MSAARRVVLCIVIGLALGVLASNVSYFASQLRNERNDIMPSGKVVGADFVCFYFAGWAFRTHPDLVYNHARMREAQERYFTDWTDPGLLPFAYPPLVAAFFAPFSLLPYLDASYLWLILSVGMAAMAFFLIVRNISAVGLPALFGVIVAASYVPLSVYCLAGGQTSCFGLLILAGFFAAKQESRHLLAGVILAASYYKPPLFIALVLFEIIERKWKTLTGLAIGGAAICAASVLTAGWEMHQAFFQALSGYGHGHEMLPGFVHKPEMGSGLLSFLLQLVPGNELLARTLFAVLSVSLIAFVCRLKTIHSEVKFSLQVCCTLFTSFWLMHYDYALLCLPLIILCSRTALAKNSVGTQAVRLAILSVYFSFLLPRLQIGGAEVKPELLTLTFLLAALLLASRGSAQHYFPDTV